MASASHQLMWVQDTAAQAVGGKAEGLRQLISWGLAVPQAFVVINAKPGEVPEYLARFYDEMGEGAVAVRSSALGEDGEDSSFAGLYETILNVRGQQALESAIDQCALSLHSQRASAYQQDQSIDAEQMCVVVQRMVDAQTAGVLFSVDPVSGRHDRLVIDAVNGLGESLVSGEQTPDHYEFDRRDELVLSETVGDQAILSEQQLQELVVGAREAVSKAGEPLDMEWAFDQEGQLFWLQARPVTTIGSDLNELDTPVKPDDVLTRCNVGEMMPGASCPLTFSTTGRAIERGMQHMHVSYAGRPEVNDEWTQLAMSHGKMFLNLSGSLAAASTVLGVDAKSMGHSVCGGIVEGLQEPAKKSIFIRLGGAIKLLRYLKNADDVIAEFCERAASFRPPTTGSSEAMVKALDDAQPFLSEAMAVHLQSSTTSGFASNILQAIISGGQESTHAEEAEAANLMAGASGVESAVLVDQLDAIVDAIAVHIECRQQFVEASPEQALRWLSSNEAGGLKGRFEAFLERHGHRSYRELCMRETSWADDTEQLIATMQASVNARLAGVQAAAKPDPVDLSTLSRGLRWILPKAHNAVRRRESTKSLLVDITNRFKQSYRALGEQLVSEQKLADADQIFFFTHDELVTFVTRLSSDPEQCLHWQHKVQKRRVALDYQNRLDFDEICIGNPKPIERNHAAGDAEGEIVGRPVSLGCIEATARVAFSVAEAAQLQPGEILVAPITDVGWTPYFSMIAGLITDVGSAVSHGAVIAREYGLPAIVNTRVGTSRIKTGDRVRLDANTGVVVVL